MSLPRSSLVFKFLLLYKEYSLSRSPTTFTMTTADQSPSGEKADYCLCTPGENDPGDCMCSDRLLFRKPTASTVTMENQTLLDEEAVYLGLRNVFRGANARLRQEKLIRMAIKKQRCREDVQKLIDQCGINALCTSAKGLLKNGIFASTAAAMIRFPELFSQSPAHNAAREASEAKATMTEEIALQEAVYGRSKETPFGLRVVKESSSM